MIPEEIEKISRYRGDELEEFWKPTLERPYKYQVDVYWFWEFREKLLGCELKILRPIPPNSCIKKKVLYRHERLAGYYYTSYCRVADMHDKILSLRELFDKPIQPIHFFVMDRFESFYLTLGSVLDMIGGVGNIIYSFGNKEDSFHDFLDNFEKLCKRTTKENETLIRMRMARRIQENLRDQIAHRPRMSTVVDSLTGKFYIEENFSRAEQAVNTVMWRKTLREISEGRKKLIPMDIQMYNDVSLLEDTINHIFECCYYRIDNYLTTNSIRIVQDSESELLPGIVPGTAKFILYKCFECSARGNIYLDTWLQPIDKPTRVCLNDECKSENIRGYYYVSD